MELSHHQPSEPVKILRPEAEPEHVYYLVAGNRLERREAEPHPRRHQVDSINSLAYLIRHFASDEQHVEVWISPTRIVVHLNGDNGRDIATMEVRKDPELATMLNQVASRVRSTLHNALGDPTLEHVSIYDGKP